MIQIALICEGVSEAKILKYILERYIGTDKVVVNNIQPTLKMSHGQEKQKNEGGWLQVLKHCTDDIVHNAFAVNDYLVVQIDTDACNQKNYDVNEYDENNQHISNDVLYERVCNRLMNDISQSVREKYSNKIIFAICFNEIECWLLPIFYENEPKKCCSTTNCIYILNKKLEKNGIGKIPDTEKNSHSADKVYQTILKKIKQKDVPIIAKYNLGFKKFVEQLDTIQVN